MNSKTSKFNFNIDDYRRLFAFYGYIPFIFSDCFARNYLRFGAIVFSNQNEWLSFISKKKIGLSLREGVKIYSQRKEYLKFYKDVYKTIDQIKSFSSVMINSRLNKRAVEKYIDLVDHFRDLYRKTEFFFTDTVFANQDKYPDFKENFKTFEKLKLDGREFLNMLFYSKSPLFVDVLCAIAKNRDIDSKSLLYYRLDELIALFDGVRVEDKTLVERSQSYLFYVVNKKVKIATAKDADALIKKINDKVNNSSVLKGVVASVGKITAKAYVIKVGFNNFALISKIINEMNQGDVLVVESTEPSVIQACQKASAILTNQGGMMSHAAIVAREFKIPCIVGLGNATNLINTGDLIEVDANKGEVKILKRA